MTTSENKIYTKNLLHLGDCIYSFILFYNIKDYIEKHNIIIYFYCLDIHIRQVKDFNCSNNILIFTQHHIPTDVKVYDLWIGSPEYSYNWYSNIEEPTIIPYDVFFCKYYNNFLKIVGIPIEIEKFIYEDNELFTRCEKINNITNNKYLNIDFLINNSTPRSEQVEYDINIWEHFIIQLSKKYNIVTTQKVDNIKCTRDDNLTVKDIAAISLNIKNFIAIESGVMSGLYNKYITENANVVYNLSKYDYHACSFSNFNIKNNIEDLYFLL